MEMRFSAGLCLLVVLLCTTAVFGAMPVYGPVPTLTLPTGAAPRGIAAFGNIIAVANQDSNNVTVYLGACNPLCHYVPRGPWPVGQAPTSIDRGRFRGAGNPLDLVTSNNIDGTVSVLLNQGAGVFARTANDPPAGMYPETVVVADFNNDGFDDIAVTNAYGNTPTVSILLNTGNCSTTGCEPTFSAPLTYALPGSNLPWGWPTGGLWMAARAIWWSPITTACRFMEPTAPRFY
jgi:hypothetical protein